MTYLDKSRYHTTNPLVNNEDILDHNGVGAVIHKKDTSQLLMFYHAKYQFWTFPIGKVGIHTNPELGMIQEVKEELNIDVKTFKLMGTFHKDYHRGNDVWTSITSYLYDIIYYSGEPINAEPLKHIQMAWMPLKEIVNLDKNQISDIVRFYIALKDILGCECRQLVR